MKIHCLNDRLVSVDELKPHPKNRNSHPAEQIERLAKILAFQGWRYPVKVSNRSGFVTSGHGRIEAARMNGWTEVPVNFQDYESDEQEYADVQADNAIAAWSELDLSGINSDLGDLGPDFDIDMLGLENFELVIGDTLEPQCDEDETPEPPVEPTTKLGDIYQLGRHRLMCGDSTSIDSVDRLMGLEVASVVFTDPPYGISLGYESAEKAKARGRRTDGLKVENDDLQGDDLQQFLLTTISNAVMKLAEGGAIYVCSPIGKEVRKFIAAMEDSGVHYQAGLVWNKSSLSLSRFDYHPKHEIIHYGWKQGAAHVWIGDRKQTTVFQWDKPSRSELHPTTKPVGLIEYYLGNSCGPGAIVLDLFGGSGSTLIACENTSRRAVLMELDPKYCDVIVARWEKYTGQKAVLLNG